MTNEQSIYRRVQRRETHSSRTGSAVLLAVILIVILAAVIVLGVWWIADPSFRDFSANKFQQLSSGFTNPAALVTGGILLVVLALLLLAAALLPGRVARRGRTTDRVALIVDDGVLADAVADAVALRGGINRSQVSATVAKRNVSVTITPTSGIPVDRAAAAAAAADTFAELGFVAKPKVTVNAKGVVA